MKFVMPLQRSLFLLCTVIVAGCTSTQNSKPQLNYEAVKINARDKSETAPARALPKQQEVQTSVEAIARLDAAIAREYESYQQYPRREYVGASTTGFHKKYIKECNDKFANLPQSTLRLLNKYQVTQPAQLTFSIEKAGMIEKVEINRSSGNRGFDEALLKIIKSMEPFPEFPAAMKARVDILSITKSFEIVSERSQEKQRK